jgi:hypothetical protein
VLLSGAWFIIVVEILFNQLRSWGVSWRWFFYILWLVCLIIVKLLVVNIKLRLLDFMALDLFIQFVLMLTELFFQ